MQFFGQDIRAWGNKKIVQNFAQSTCAECAFFERLRIQNMLLVACKSTAYSMPKVYASIYGKIRNRYYGMETFMNNCEPLLMSMDDVSKSVQRRFKNQWDSCWANLGKDIGLSDETVKTINELGIRICFTTNFDSIPDEVFEFYNTMLKWCVYTSTEGALAETGLTPIELVDRMILQKPELFVHDIQWGF